LPEIKDLRDEEDIEIDQTLSSETKEKAIEGVKKAGIKEWGIWLKTYKDKYGIQFKPSDDGIDNEDFDHESSSSVITPDRSQSNSSNNTQQAPQQTQEQVEAQSQS
ncbi:hypothetical protein R7X07_02005, partial [Mesomycoplasma ovipneumoniae]